jgi:hypothetical protein
LIARPCSREHAENFNEFWARDLAVPVEQVIDISSNEIAKAAIKQKMDELRRYSSGPENFEPEVRLAIANLLQAFPTLLQKMTWQPITFISDAPGKNAGNSGLGEGREEVSLMIDDSSDSRRGLSLIIRPNDQTLKNISNFLAATAQIEPEQYYYNKPEIHTTVISIITYTNGFELNQVNIPDYVEVIDACIAKIDPFELRCAGITTSANCIMLCGFSS